jgi:hypothetical protein
VPELPPALAAGLDPANATELRIVDWPAAPARVRARFGRREADRLCDELTPDGEETGRLAYQEEYAEWRVVRDAAGPVRFELTTELSELRGESNTLDALRRMAADAAVPLLLLDADSGEPRFPSGSEVIATLRDPGSARDDRGSDPVIVERLARLATEGRPIRFDDPLGVYIVDVQASELLTPEDEPMPREWLRLSREASPSQDGLPRHQRLELEVPAGAGFTLAQLRSARTGRRIEYGGQIAELVQVAVYLRVGRPGVVG